MLCSQNLSILFGLYMNHLLVFYIINLNILLRIWRSEDYIGKGLVWMEGCKVLESNCFLQHVFTAETQECYLKLTAKLPNLLTVQYTIDSKEQVFASKWNIFWQKHIRKVLLLLLLLLVYIRACVKIWCIHFTLCNFKILLLYPMRP